jgi:predicted permease
MILRILSIIAPVAACAAAGFAWARLRRPYDVTMATRLVMNVGAPCLVVSSFQESSLSRDALAGVGLAAVVVSVGVALLALVALRLARLPLNTFLPSVVFQNTGNMGLPICLFAFGETGLALAIVVFLWVSTCHFTIGVAIYSGERHIARLLRTPLVYATATALVLVLTGWRLPVWAARTVEILGGLAIPLMLLTLGFSLAGLRMRSLSRGLLVAAMRFAFGFGVGLGVAHAFGLSGVARGVVILQSSMPSAVINYMMAERYRRSPEDVAGVVSVATLMSLVVVPLVLFFVLR